MKRLFLAGCLVLAACGGASEDVASPPPTPSAGPSPTEAGPASPLQGIEWVAMQIDGEPVSIEQPPTATFSADGTVAGTDGCNQYSGAYTDTDGSLNMGPFASTQMACGGDADEVSQAFLSVMNGRAEYRREGSSLTVESLDGWVRFAAGPG